MGKGFFWLFMTASAALIPVVMLLMGRAFCTHPPREINAAWGYRTRRSMRSRDTWDFANRRCGEVWKRWGAVLLVLSAVPMALAAGREIDTIGLVGGAVCLVQTAVMASSLVTVERALKRTFDEAGNRI